MCGIVAVVRRRARPAPSTTPAPDLAGRLRRSARSTKPRRCCVASSTIPMRRASRRSRDGSSRWSDRCAALPAPRCCSAIRSGSPRSNIEPRRSPVVVNELDVALDTDGALTREIESLNAALVVGQGRVLGAQPRPVAYRPFGGAARCVVTGCRIHRDVPLDPDRARRRSIGSRCAAATPPGCTCSSPVTVSTSPIRRSRG